MMYSLKTALACATLAAALVPLAASAADDSPAMSMASMPCSQAAMAMSGGMHHDMMKGDAMKGDAMKGDAMKGDAMKAPTSVDAAFKAGGMMRMKEMMEMAKLEIRCGTDPKAKEAAQDALKELQQSITMFNSF